MIDPALYNKVVGLAWKSFIQRRYYWHVFVAEVVIAVACFISMLLFAGPGFMNSDVNVKENPHMSEQSVYDELPSDLQLAYAPRSLYIDKIMRRAGQKLGQEFMPAFSMRYLSTLLYNDYTKNKTMHRLWVIWRESEPIGPKSYSIRSTELSKTKMATFADEVYYFKSGFLSVQMAVDSAILEDVIRSNNLSYKLDISLQQFPHSEHILLVFSMKPATYILILLTLALMQPGIETQWHIVSEKTTPFLILLRIYKVSYGFICLNWWFYSAISSFAISVFGVYIMVMIFRWTGPLIIFILLFLYSILLSSWVIMISTFHKNRARSTFWNITILAHMTFITLIFSYFRGHFMNMFLFSLICLVVPPVGMLNCIHHLIAADFHSIGLDFYNSGDSTQYLNIGMTFFVWMLSTLFNFCLTIYFENVVPHSLGGSKPWHYPFTQGKKTINFETSDDYGSTNWDNVQCVPETTAVAVRCRRITKVFTTNHRDYKAGVAVDNLSIDIYRGEITTILGQSGSGKTTLINMMLGLCHPTQGTIHIWGYDAVTEQNYLFGILGYCPNDNALREYLTVEEHLKLFMRLGFAVRHASRKMKNRPNDDEEEEMETPRASHTEHDLASAGLLQSMDLDSLMKHMVRDLNEDARLRLRVGLMALQGARVLIFDNPSDGLGLLARENLWNMITSFRKIYSVLICTEDTDAASRIADRVIAMENGHVRCAGSLLYMMKLYGRSYTLTIKLLHSSKQEDFNLFVRKTLPRAQLHSIIGFCHTFSVPIGIEVELAKFLGKLEKKKINLNINYFVISIPTLNDIYKRACSISKAPLKRAYDKTKLQEMKKKKDMALLLVKNKHSWERLEGKELRKCTFRTFMDKTVHYRKRRSNFFLFFLYTLALSIPFIVPGSISFALKDDFVLVNMSKPYTIDAIEYHNTLIIRTNEEDDAKRIGMLFSCTVPEQINLDLIVIPKKERIGRYLKFLAIDEPLKYATAFAYSLDVNVTKDLIFLNALYSITTNDRTTAPKTLNKATSTLHKFLTKNAKNSIVIYNEPIAIRPIRLLDNDLYLTVTFIPLIILIVTAIHASLSSEEHGLPRAIQLLSGDQYSPLFYWISFYVFDLCGYLAMIVIFVILIPMVFALGATTVEFGFIEYTALSLLFVTYGLCEIPLSYLFQRISKEGPLNTMLFILNNFVFSQGILIMQNFYPDKSLFYSLLNLHPHFNFAYGFSKFRVIHSFNGACDRFLKSKNCSDFYFHPCCPTCTVFNTCFKKKKYLSYPADVDNPGIARELTASFLCSFLFFGLLLLVEYRYLPKVWYYILNNLIFPGRLPTKDVDISTIIEKTEVEEEWKSIMKKTQNARKWDPRGGLLIRSLWLKKNGSEPTLRDINLKVPLGETIAISDPDFEGRKYLMKTLARIGPTPLCGEAFLQGHYNLLKSLPHANRCIGYCSKENTFVTWLTVEENIKLMAKLRGVPTKYIDAEVNKWMHALELNEERDVSSKNLDPVSIRKLCLVLALVGDPQLIILDEPTYGMDSVTKLQACSVLALVQATEHIILYGTLSMEEVQALCDRIAVIVHGKIICVSDLDQLIKRYCYGCMVVVEANLGESGNNFTQIIKSIEEKFGSVDINDLTDKFINFQILDRDLSWSDAFVKMEDLKKCNENVISYVITSTTLEEIFRNLVSLRNNDTALKLPPICCPRQRKRYKEMVTQNSENTQVNTNAYLGNYYDLRNMNNIAWKGIFSTNE